MTLASMNPSGLFLRQPRLRRAAKTLAYLVAGGAFVGVGVLCWFANAPGPMDFAKGQRVSLAKFGEHITGARSDLLVTDPVERGRYLTQAADCQACHTVEGGRPFAGGRPFKTQFGTLYSPNITPDAETGIGKWTDAQFIRAVHEGVGPGGKNLYPAFPYASYTYLIDDDVLAIRAFLATLPPIRNIAPENELGFPFNQRALMAVWRLMFNANERFNPIATNSATWNRGAYLVEGLAHCGDCHTPRNLFQALDNGEKFSGAVADGWRAFNITSDDVSGVGAWTDEQLATYLSTAHVEGHGTASGPMAEAIDLSLSKLTASDILSIVTYLKTVPGTSSPEMPALKLKPAFPSTPPSEEPVGARIYAGACASCHGFTGVSSLSQRASFIGARSINDPVALNVAQVILHGTGIAAAPGRLDMPRFGKSFSDSEIAAVSNYVTSRFGAKASQLTADQVGALR
ncbi:cytochrome c [Rhizobium sp. S152]|uniref:cytochrome c n=1 Tax=Rhizobium sp. S152 TaxID=3055038 RepID=UPI0025A9D8F2|nr:cytochrome c [Rhizobium sp. S152]MDM9628492.1 cytochrome c [Rhizobium sp. S152]